MIFTIMFPGIIPQITIVASQLGFQTEYARAQVLTINLDSQVEQNISFQKVFKIRENHLTYFSREPGV